MASRSFPASRRRAVATATVLAVVAGLLVGFAAPAAAAPPAYIQVAGSPFQAGAASKPAGVAYRPDGKLVATANNGSASLSVFTVGAGGALTLGPNSPFAAGSGPRGVAFHPTSSVIAVANFNSANVMTFTATLAGLVAAADTEAVAGNVPAVAFSPDGQFLAAAENGTGRLYVWTVDLSGNLTAAPGSPILTGGGNASSLAWAPNGVFVAVGDNIANDVRTFNISLVGTPTAAFGPFATPPSPTGVAISPSGLTLATANSSGSISTFTLSLTGVLSNRQDFARGPSTPRSVKFSPAGTRLAVGGGTPGTLLVESVNVGTGVLTPLSGSPYPTNQGFNFEAAWSPDGQNIATANFGSTTASVFGPYHAPIVPCTAAEIRASQRFWVFGNKGEIDFGTSGTTATPLLLPGTFNAGEGSTSVSDTLGNLLFYSNGASVFDRNGNAMPNGTGLLGSPSATQTVAAFPAVGTPGVYFIVTTTTNYVVSSVGTLHYSKVDMSLNGGLGDVTAVKNVQLGTTNSASEALSAIPNDNGTGFWALTQQAGAANLLAYQFNGAGPTTGTAVVSPIGTGGSSGRTINVSPDLTQIVLQSTGGVVRVADFDGLNGIAQTRFTWTDVGPGGEYSADFSPSGDYVYTAAINSAPHLHRYLIAGQPTSAAVAASLEDLGAIGGNGGQVRRGPDDRVYAARSGQASLAVVNTPDTVATPAIAAFALAAGSVSSYGLPQTATGCALAASVTVPPGDPVACTGAVGHKVEFRKSSAVGGSLAAADALLATNVSDASVTARAFDDGRPVVNYLDSGSNPAGPPTPTDVGTTALLFTTKGTFNGTAFDNNFAMRSRGLINITDISGPYTFSVGADDGFRLRIGTNPLLVASDDVPSPFATTTGAVTFPAIGCYPYTLEWFQSTSVAGLELRASGPTITGLQLIGDTANTGLEVRQGSTRAPVSQPEVVAASTNLSLGQDLATGTPFTNVTFGTKALTPLIGDWDGNGSDTIGTYEVGTFKLRNANTAGSPDLTFAFGDSRGYGISGDFNGDGTDDVGVYRAGTWQIHFIDSGDPDPAPFTLGAPFGTGIWPATVPVAGDWDGDGVDGIGTYVNGTWYLKNVASAGGPDFGPIAFGGPGRYPVVGDWTGIGVDTPGNRTGVAWTARTTFNAAPVINFDFGATNSVPLSWQGPYPPT